jgi:cytosine deaminase
MGGCTAKIEFVMNYGEMLEIAIVEARIGLAEGGIPIGAALFDGEGNL